MLDIYCPIQKCNMLLKKKVNRKQFNILTIQISTKVCHMIQNKEILRSRNSIF